MARNTSKKKAAEAVEEAEVEESTAKPSGIERVLNRSDVQANWRAFSEFIEENGGPKINPKHVGIVLTGYKFYQRSDAAVAAREEDAAVKAEAVEQKQAAREARAQARAEKAAAAAERKAAREAAAAEKAAASKKTAAQASKPKGAVKAGKSTATAKKPAVKKTAAKKGGRKAAF